MNSHRPSHFASLIAYFAHSSLFKNASVGDKWAQAAAYRYNREQRYLLPIYIARWLGLCMSLFMLLAWIDSELPTNGPTLFAVCLLGIGFALSFCQSMTLAYAYLYLSWKEE